MPVIMLSGGIMMAFMTKANQTSLEATGKAGSLAEEVISSIRTIHAFGVGTTLKDKFDTLIQTMRKAGKRGVVGEALGLAVMCESFVDLASATGTDAV